ncbi:MAG: electron transport complex subunit E [Nitrosomonadales bacterium]|jgi:electron transport complex protein RnfE|nr:electron transport complex subunit E [Nitrosomonadales bacterium]MBT3918002.1 electron transport complex subunit E [Nitrosomonadales bacterium]MBT4183266.1 electron transport complex subunit E [Nitrosomonadales bacterium]MBT4571249.1 electron transport complex subunit E [Nitrosomonadales bacterium]MBT4759073.1 electron transport complex subunit E [Nitrosomonadales bacterium]
MFKESIINGLWKQNPGTVQLLGLCPTLAMTNTIVNGVSLGIATMLVMSIANTSIAPIRKFIPDEVRVPIFILVIAALVTVVDLSIHAYAEPLYQTLGIFIPLIVTNCIVLARVESFASKNPILPSFYDGLFMGLGLCLVLAILGAMREFLGQGTLFSGLNLIFGDTFNSNGLSFFDQYEGFLLAILPPGAFLGLAFMIAFMNWVNQKN